MSGSRRYPREIPPLWLLLSIAAMVALHLLAPIGTLLPWPWNLAGFGAVAAGIWLVVASAARFFRRGTDVVPFRNVTALVDEGAFRRTRNPMYLGLVGVALGAAIALGSVSPFAVPPLLFLLLDRRFVRREEQFLRERFGADYDAYCARVRRWL